MFAFIDGIWCDRYSKFPAFPITPTTTHFALLIFALTRCFLYFTEYHVITLRYTICLSVFLIYWPLLPFYH
jgi:hypothetical protein